MSKRAFDKIADGLKEAIAVASGKSKPSMTDDEMRSVARALFDAENEWRRMQQGEAGDPMDDRSFKVQIVYWMLLARAAIASIHRVGNSRGK